MIFNDHKSIDGSTNPLGMTKLLRTSHNSLASCPGCDACDALLQAQPMGATPMGRPKLKSSALLAVLEIKNLSTVAEGCALITRCKRCPAEIIEVALDCLKASLVPTVQARRSQVFLYKAQSLAFPRCHRAARAQGPQSSRSSTRTACLHDRTKNLQSISEHLWRLKSPKLFTSKLNEELPDMKRLRTNQMMTTSNHTASFQRFSSYGWYRIHADC